MRIADLKVYHSENRVIGDFIGLIDLVSGTIETMEKDEDRFTT